MWKVFPRLLAAYLSVLQFLTYFLLFLQENIVAKNIEFMTTILVK